MFFNSSVLEFELRKAQDTIKSLRASLTKTAGIVIFQWPGLPGKFETCTGYFYIFLPWGLFCKTAKNLGQRSDFKILQSSQHIVVTLQHGNDNANASVDECLLFVSFSETEVLTPESPEERIEDVGENAPLRPYEKRALNFLVNEYLLTQDYKLTSVTFAEENENQVCLSKDLYHEHERSWQNVHSGPLPSSLVRFVGFCHRILRTGMTLGSMFRSHRISCVCTETSISTPCPSLKAWTSRAWRTWTPTPQRRPGSWKTWRMNW